jgi:hypothetical protein
MPTSWSYPTQVTQYCEADVHIPWINVDDKFTKINYVRSQKDLIHMSNPMVNDMRMKTYYLKLTGFEWDQVLDTVNGIEVMVNTRRGGRITDETVQLWSNGNTIGANLARANLDGYGNIVILNEQTYGAPTDLWGLETLDASLVYQDFGIVLRYQTHPRYPHVTTPNIEHIQIRLW